MLSVKQRVSKVSTIVEMCRSTPMKGGDDDRSRGDRTFEQTLTAADDDPISTVTSMRRQRQGREESKERKTPPAAGYVEQPRNNR